jgi:hypothetical protein
MADHTIPNELLLKRFWVFDPPPELFQRFEFSDLVRVAVIQLKAQHAALKAQEEAIEETLEVYQRYVGK